MESVDWNVWLNHFEHHGRQTLGPVSGDALLDAGERRLIGTSVAAIELLARSDALIQSFERCTEAEGPALAEVLQLLNAEHRCQARLLRVFTGDHAIGSAVLTDARPARRWVANLADPESCVIELLSAEVIGTVYFDSLEAVTGSLRLKCLCRKFVCNGLARVGFESELWEQSADPWTWLSVRGTLLAHDVSTVWQRERQMLRCAGHDRRSFLRACEDRFDFYLERRSRGQADAATSRMRVISEGTPKRLGGPQYPVPRLT